MIFLPIAIFKQFKSTMNLFFLLIILTQLVSSWRVASLTYISPLAFVLFLAVVKEAYDDFYQRKQDSKFNDQVYDKLDRDKGKKSFQRREILTEGNFEEVTSAGLRVGDIIKIKKGQRIPADMVLLYIPDDNETAFIDMQWFNGDKDWKSRRPVKFTNRYYDENKTLANLKEAHIYAEPPCGQISEFRGKFLKGVFEDNNADQVLSIQNTLWANCELASADYIIGIIIYTGKETRARMYAKSPPNKKGLLEQEINFL